MATSATFPRTAGTSVSQRLKNQRRRQYRETFQIVLSASIAFVIVIGALIHGLEPSVFYHDDTEQTTITTGQPIVASHQRQANEAQNPAIASMSLTTPTALANIETEAEAESEQAIPTEVALLPEPTPKAPKKPAEPEDFDSALTAFFQAIEEKKFDDAKRYLEVAEGKAITPDEIKSIPGKQLLLYRRRGFHQHTRR